MGFPNSKHVCRDPRFRARNWPHRLPIRHHLQRHLLRAGLYDGIDRLLLPASPLLLGAVQAGALLHRPGDLHRILPLHPDLQLLRQSFAPCAVEDGVMNYAKCDPELGYTSTGHSFNDAYRYMDWLLTVPLLLIEIVLVMKLSPEETKKQSLRLGVLSGLMILNGYPGESSGDASTRWTYWTLSMLPFCYIVYTLFVGLKESQDSQPEAVRDQVKWACWATVISWCTYPIVYIMPMLSGSSTGKAGLTAGSMVAIQVGYTVSDVISKCGVGFLVYNIAATKSAMERGDCEEDCVKADV